MHFHRFVANNRHKMIIQETDFAVYAHLFVYRLSRQVSYSLGALLVLTLIDELWCWCGGGVKSKRRRWRMWRNHTWNFNADWLVASNGMQEASDIHQYYGEYYRPTRRRRLMIVRELLRLGCHPSVISSAYRRHHNYTRALQRRHEATDTGQLLDKTVLILQCY